MKLRLNESFDPPPAMNLYPYLSKLLPLLILPLGFVLIAGLCALLLLVYGRRKAAIGLQSLALSTLWVCSMPMVANVLYGRLENKFPPLPLAEIPASECIVLLGGAVEPVLFPQVDINFNEAIDRVYKAAQLYRAGKTQVVIVSAGNQPWSEPGPSEAELLSELLGEWGVPAAAIRIEGQSRNTRENAVNSAPLLQQSGCKRPLLVTSAAHMPRSVAAFAALGIEVFPVSADVRVTRSSGYSVLDFLPDAEALAMTSGAVRERMGQAVYAWRGWN